MFDRGDGAAAWGDGGGEYDEFVVDPGLVRFRSGYVKHKTVFVGFEMLNIDRDQ